MREGVTLRWVVCTPDVNETQERHEHKECGDVSDWPATGPIEEFTDRNVQITDHTMLFLVGSLPSPPLSHHTTASTTQA
jgi:hypothetical protein